MRKKILMNISGVMNLMLICMAFLFSVMPAKAESEFIVLCYHDIPVSAKDDSYGVDVKSLVNQIEYLRTHGYHFIRPDDVLAAHRHEKDLPEKAVLMTFDDAYASFYSNVIPIIELYNCPAVLAVCSFWIDNTPPSDLPAPLMTWEQIAEVASHPLVTIASHSHDLHHAVVYNPQGNTGQAATSHIYFPESNSYETETQYRKRISDDLEISRETLLKKTGQSPSIIVWPYGEYNQITIEEARRQGFAMAFTITLANKRGSTGNLMELNRWLVEENPSIMDFIDELQLFTPPARPFYPQSRAMQVDLDLIYDPDPQQTERNLGQFLDRIVEIKPSTVYLQAFADPDGDGNVEEVYFPNRVLPTRMDLLNRVSNQLYIRGFAVYVWMPTLSIILPDRKQNEKLLVMELEDGQAVSSSSQYRRLSPFSEEAADLMAMLYEDLAAYVRFNGVLFQDDAYLSSNEDFHPSAIRAYEQKLGLANFNPLDLSEKQMAEWTRLKTNRLHEFIEVLKASVRKYRPHALFVRNLYAGVLACPESEEWFAQNYGASLRQYDQVVIMAYPELEHIAHPASWLEGLVKKSSQYPDGLDKTVFKIQAFNWKNNQWLSNRTIVKWLRRLVAAGARHVAYYPDDYTVNKPACKFIIKEISTQNMLFPKPRRPKK